MKKINSIKILNISVEGFKIYKDKQVFEFGDMTFISGSPKLGKSSIGAAIAFAFTGTSYIGEKSVDRLINNTSHEVEVSVKFVDEMGEIHELVRSRKNDTTAISYNNYNIRQTDINQMIGEKDLFLSIFNPLYFIEILGADGKEMLEKMLPMIKHEDVLKVLDESTQTLLETESILSPETYIKNRREEIKEQEENLIYLQGQIDLQDTEIKKAVENMQHVNDALVPINEEIATLEEEQKKSANTSENEETVAELYGRLDELAADESDNMETDKLYKNICEMEATLEQLKKVAWQSPYIDEIAQKNAALQVLLMDYTNINDLIKNVQPGYKCPTCFHEINDSNIQSAISALQEKLSVCLKIGKEANALFETIKEKDKAEKIQFEESQKYEIVLLEKNIGEAKAKYKEMKVQQHLANEKRKTDMTTITNVITELESLKENGNLSAGKLQRLQELRQMKQENIMKLEIFQQVIDRPDLKTHVIAKEQEINRLTVLINSAIIYIGKRYELLFRGLNMNKVKIQLFEIIKTTGEIKDTFKFTYDGRDYRMLSDSEKVLAGLEVAELIKQLSNRNYPTFIDRWESVCVIENVRPTSQLIFSKVELGKPLTVAKRDNILEKAA